MICQNIFFPFLFSFYFEHEIFLYNSLFYKELLVINELVSRKRYKFACGPIKTSDHTVHMHSLVRVFDGHSMSSQGSNVSSSGKLRL